MHMADALLSPGVGAGLWAAAAGLVAWSARRLQHDADDRRVPLMGVLGAFVFAAQMVNFAIPGTGSSGHLGGGLLLAILLGPHAAVLVIASVLTVQALFFADGGLLALGCNIVNLALFPAFVAYPLVYRRIAGDRPGRTRLAVACVAAAVVGLQLGALAVVLETTASGISALPVGSFLLFMQPIHLAIGVVEGLVTASVIAFVLGARPDLLLQAAAARRPLRGVVTALAAAALAIGGIVSGFASQQPDGLEWSVAHATGGADIAVPGDDGAGFLARLQQRVAVLPDYGFRGTDDRAAAARLGTSVAGLVGGLMTLALALGLGLWLRPRTPQR